MHVFDRLWVVPLLCLLAGALLGVATVAIDRASDYGLVGQSLTGTPSDVQNVLSLIAQSVFTLASVVLSLTLVAVQLAMGQFSPRIVRSLLTDRRSQFAIGLFLATFAYTVIGLREVNDQAPHGGTVPGLTVLVAYALAAASLVVLLLFVHHTGQSIRVDGIIDLVGDQTREQLDRVYPPRGDAPEAADPSVVAAPQSGVVVHVDVPRLVEAARSAGCVLELVPAMGDFVPECAPLLRAVHGSAPPAAVARLVRLDRERTHTDDPAYGIRKLVDIAERTCADPFDDPTTTVQAIDRIHDCLRLLARRPFPTGRHCDELGDLRLVLPVLDWDGYVRLGFDEIRLAGAANPQIARRLRAALLDLRDAAPAERRLPVERQLDLLDAGVRRSFDDEQDVAAAAAPDQQGIGSGADVRLAATGNGGAPARPRS